MSQKVLFVDLRESLMPSLLHARHLHQNKSPALLLFSGLALTIVASMTASILAMMTLCYRYGIRELQLDWASQTTTAVYENIYRLVAMDTETGSWIFIFALAGAVLMLVLVTCYHRIYWWPIHPLGYLTAYSSAMRILWVSFFIGWACNALCMRYGGIVLFKKLQYFFHRPDNRRFSYGRWLGHCRPVYRYELPGVAGLIVPQTISVRFSGCTPNGNILCMTIKN